MACSSNPCRNGASCFELNNGGYSCVCPSGFTGPRCENQINYCQINPCNYGGTCISLVGSFRCICPTGTTGNACEQSNFYLNIFYHYFKFSNGIKFFQLHSFTF